MRPLPATRARMETFIRSFDGLPGQTLAEGVAACLARHGVSWLNDDQIADITERLVSDARFSQRLRVRNRRALQQRSAA